ncbi:MAG: uroporphyrinogen decarboxylase family protein [Chthonomonadales bacterium]
MTSKERVLAACAGGSVDRVPYSLWYHFRLDPPAGENMAQAELQFYRLYTPDLFKVMHDIPYEMPEGMPVVKSAEDWRALPVLDGVSGNFGAQLGTVQRIIQECNGDVPVIDTVFSIFSTAQKVCGNRTLEFLKTDPDALHAGLRALAASLANYSSALVSHGADGIYLAISGAARDTMDEATYRQHFARYDQQILDAASGGRVNVAHHHGVGIYPEIVLEMKGFRIYSWSNRLPGNPSIREMRVRTKTCLMTGIDETKFAAMTPEEIVAQGRDAVAEAGGKGFILAPGCAVPTPPETSQEQLAAFQRAVSAG